jgi:ABC-type sugar transport system substrate-binding protein
MLWLALLAVPLAMLLLGPAPELWAAEDHYAAAVPAPKVPAGKKIRVVVFIPNGPDPYFQSKWYGYEDEAKRLGVTFQLFDAGGYANLSKQIQQFEDAIQTKPDAIILNAVSSTGMVPSYNKAVAAKIPVVVDNIALRTPVAVQVMKSDYEIGMLNGAGLVDAIGGKGKIAMLPGPPGADAAKWRYNGAVDYIKRFKGVKIAITKWSASDPAEGLKNMEDILQAHPDLKGVYCFGGLIQQGIVQALKARGKKPGAVAVSCQDIAKHQEQAMREGYVQVLVPNTPVNMARDAMRLAVMMAMGQKVPEMTWNRTVIVTPKNVNSYDFDGNNPPEGWKAKLR